MRVRCHSNRRFMVLIVWPGGRSTGAVHGVNGVKAGKTRWWVRRKQQCTSLAHTALGAAGVRWQRGMPGSELL